MIYFVHKNKISITAIHLGSLQIIYDIYYILILIMLHGEGIYALRYTT
jgi:hypothetical protein